MGAAGARDRARLRAGFLVQMLAAALPGCGGTAGNHLVTFQAVAAGPVDAALPLDFTNDLGYAVELRAATLHIGAIYLNQTLPVAGAQAQGCVLPGVYVGQVVAGLDVDLLSPAAQAFPIAGEGTDLAARAGEIWLTHAGVSVDAVDDSLPVLRVEGTAQRDGLDYPFSATLTIGKNRAIPLANPAQPGANPICKQRIVTPIPLALTLVSGGQLTMRADPRVMLAGADFAALAPAIGDPPVFEFADTSTPGPALSLYAALHFAATVYRFEWTDPPTDN
jgi:hypothetical protein